MIAVISELVKELSSELDLHYEDNEMFALEPTIQQLERAKILLERERQPVPNVLCHLLRRFKRNYH